MIGNVSIWQLLIVLVIILLIFGSKKIGSLGSDLGAAIKGFRKAITSSDDIEQTTTEQKSQTETTK